VDWNYYGRSEDADFWEPPDPPEDTSTTIRCTNQNCFMYFDPEEATRHTRHGATWHPTTFTEYQGVEPHGGPVQFHEDDAFNCPACGEEGREL
jgi:hypothetical protein